MGAWCGLSTLVKWFGPAVGFGFWEIKHILFSGSTDDVGLLCALSVTVLTPYLQGFLLFTLCL